MVVTIITRARFDSPARSTGPKYQPPAEFIAEVAAVLDVTPASLVGADEDVLLDLTTD